MAGKGKKGGGGSDSGSSEIKGNRKDNLLVGTDGDDRILAGLGNDDVFAGAGNDFVVGDGGDDTLRGEDGNDKLLGYSGNDEILGGAGHDTLEGGLGDDDMNGGTGDDYLTGNLGADTIDGGAMTGEFNTAAFDNLGGDGNPDAGIILVGSAVAGSYTSTNETAPGMTETDTLLNIHKVLASNYDDQMLGGDGNDFFLGSYGFDTLSGGNGDDTLVGGLDDDVLEGGDGADSFVFFRYADGIGDPGFGDGADQILDFDPTEDRLVFLSNEALDLSKFTATVIDGNTVLTYEAEPDAFGPSTVTLVGVELAGDPVTGDIDLLNASYILIPDHADYADFI